MLESLIRPVHAARRAARRGAARVGRMATDDGWSNKGDFGRKSTEKWSEKHDFQSHEGHIKMQF